MHQFPPAHDAPTVKKTKNSRPFLAACLFISLFIPLSLSATDRPEKPNVVLILTDDLGWQDVGCYDIDEPSPYETPNIDRLAGEGIRFFQGYSPAPTCAPSRCAILSGKHPARAQKTHVVGGHPPTPYGKPSPLIEPWYSGRMEMSEFTLAEALQSNGYTTGCVGKWHCAINHRAYPQPKDQGFDVSHMSIGATQTMRPDRLSDFATTAADDPFQLDENGMPKHQNSIDALNFVEDQKENPFFLYYATWLVHTPIHSRNEALLKKYCDKLGVPFPTDPEGWALEGQKNPYYAAMVEMLDYYVGQMLTYLNETDDPRWPGHKLVENTYIIFTSDNGGMETHPGEIITDNYPLDRGKINAREGGVRVPLLISGPGIEAGATSEAMINGLDFYPTILSWTGTPKPEAQPLDGLDLAPFLTSPTLDPALITHTDGSPRDTMTWHFPNSVAMQSTIRRGNFKLIRRWQDKLKGNPDHLELFQLYGDDGKRVDIEEAKNLAQTMPELTTQLDALLQTHLDEMKASPPFLNPKVKLPNNDKVCIPLDHGREDNRVWVTYEEQGAKVVRANLIYTKNGGDKYEEWHRAEATITSPGKIEADLPTETTHYVFNLIDENHFLVSYPEMRLQKGSQENYSVKAIEVANPKIAPVAKGKAK